MIQEIFPRDVLIRLPVKRAPKSVNMRSQAAIVFGDLNRRTSAKYVSIDSIKEIDSCVSQLFAATVTTLGVGIPRPMACRSCSVLRRAMIAASAFEPTACQRLLPSRR